jgi:hypothetical protein
VRLRRRVSGHALLQETGDATSHMDTRAPDSKLCVGRAVDLVETVSTAVALAISLDIAQERASCADITVHPWPLSVTERPVLPPQKRAVSIPTFQKFKLHEWLVPPIVVPILLGLLIAGAVIVQW